jgi:hypothetical protein
MGEDEEPGQWLREWELDNHSIEVRLVEDPTGKVVQEVWSAELLQVEQTDNFDYETIGRLTEALVPNEQREVPYVVGQRRTYMSWGADASAQQILLEASAWGVGTGVAAVFGNAVYDALKAAVLKLATEARSRAEWDPEPLGEEEAVQRARWHLIRHFELDTDEETGDRQSLALAGEEERSDGSRVVRFRDGDRRYEVEFVDEAGLVAIGRIGWTDGD